MGKAKPSHEPKEGEISDLQGYFTADRRAEDAARRARGGDARGEGIKDDDEEEEEDDNLMEDLLFDDDGEVSSFIPTPSRERTMMKKGSGKAKEIKAKGKFPIDGPWWNISVKARKEGSLYVCQGWPSYSLREGVAVKCLLQQLLYEIFPDCRPGSADKQMLQSFWDYFEAHHTAQRYTFAQFFVTLQDALQVDLAESDPSRVPIMQVAKVIMARFDENYECFHGRPMKKDKEKNSKVNGGDLKLVYRCYKYPRLFKILPALFEQRALSLLLSEEMQHLETLNTVLKECPEDFGFYTSMKRHGLGSIEAKFKGFVNAGMIPDGQFRCTSEINLPTCGQTKSKSKQPSTSTANHDQTTTKTSRTKADRLATPKVSVEIARCLKVYDIVKCKCTNEKHTFLYKSSVQREWNKDAYAGFPLNLEVFKELEKRRVVDIEENRQNAGPLVKFHWARYRRCEESIASSLERLIQRHAIKPLSMDYCDLTKYNFDEFQHRAAEHICREPVTVLLGRGGSGKTHVVSSVIKEFKALSGLLEDLKDSDCPSDGKDETTEESEGEMDREDDKKHKGLNSRMKDKPSVLLTAPTGRAASILQRRTGANARTLHSIRYSSRNRYCEEEEDGFIFSDVEILVVDEASLTPISVLSPVLSMLLDYKLRKVIFLGDPHQLPSIDPGNFLQDIIQAFRALNLDYVKTLEINHRTDEGGRLIVENAKKITEKKIDLEFAPERFEFIDTSAHAVGTGLQQEIKRLIENRRQLRSDWNSQIVAFRNADVKFLNSICCQRYSGHASYKNGKLNLHICDKICARKNVDITVLKRHGPKGNAGEVRGRKAEERKKDEAGPSKMESGDTERISNGDTFLIKNWRVMEEDNKKKDIVTLQSLDEDEGVLFEVYLKELINKCKIQYAWVRTINTFQGSETDYIVYVIGQNSYYETWQHLYTAITRGRKGCFIVGTPSSLRRVIQTNPRPRQTSLARFLMETFEDQRPTGHEQVDPRTPERPGPSSFSSSNRAVECPPCRSTPRQDRSNQASRSTFTALSSPYQSSPQGLQEGRTNRCTPSRPSTSSTNLEDMVAYGSTPQGPSSSGCTPKRLVNNGSYAGTPVGDSKGDGLSASKSVSGINRVIMDGGLVSRSSYSEAFSSNASFVQSPSAVKRSNDGIPCTSSSIPVRPVCNGSMTLKESTSNQPLSSSASASSTTYRWVPKGWKEDHTNKSTSSGQSTPNQSVEDRSGGEAPVNRSAGNGPYRPNANTSRSTPVDNRCSMERPAIRTPCNKPPTSSAGAVQPAVDINRSMAETLANVSRCHRSPPSSAPPVSARVHEMTALLNKACSTASSKAVAVSGCKSAAVDSLESTSAAAPSPGKESFKIGATGHRSSQTSTVSKSSPHSCAGNLPMATDASDRSSHVKSSGDQSAAEEYLPGRGQADQIGVPSESKAKPNRDRLSRKKRKENKNSESTDQGLPLPKADGSTDQVETEVAGKKSCPWKSSEAGKECLDKDPAILYKQMEYAEERQRQPIKEGTESSSAIQSRSSKPSPNPLADKAYRNLDKDQARTSPSLARQQGDSPFTAIQTRGPNTPLKSCHPSPDHVIRSGFKFKRSKLGSSITSPDNKVQSSLIASHSTESSPSQSPSQGIKSETSPLPSQNRVTHSREISRDYRSARNSGMTCTKTQSSSELRSPLANLTSRSNQMVNPVSSKSLQGKRTSTLQQGNPPSLKKSKAAEVQANKPKAQPKNQSSRSNEGNHVCISSVTAGRSPTRSKFVGDQPDAFRVQQRPQSLLEHSQETLIHVPGLTLPRYRHTRRLQSQNSEDIAASSQMTGSISHEGSETQEMSQSILQPPSPLQVHPFVSAPGGCLDDDYDTDSDETDLSSSGSCACVVPYSNPHKATVADDENDIDGDNSGHNLSEDDNEDEEPSQFILQ